jgi:hypothetical protein
MKIQFVANGVKWFDRVNGNTYHSVSILRCSDGEILNCPFQYGYGDAYRQTALSAMLKAGWFNNYGRKSDGVKIGTPYDEKTLYLFERENNYPIDWNCFKGLKRECIANGIK